MFNIFKSKSKVTDNEIDSYINKDIKSRFGNYEFGDYINEDGYRDCKFICIEYDTIMCFDDTIKRPILITYNRDKIKELLKRQKGKIG